MARYEDILVLKDNVSATLEKINNKFKNINKTTDKATEKIQKFQAQTEKIKNLGSKISGFGQKLTVGVTLPVIAAGGAMVKLASDMEETLNKVDVSFGKSSDRVKEWAKTSIKTMGLAQQSALDSAALYGDMATGMGMSQEKAAEMAMSLTQLGADLASFKNISNDVAQTALKSIFTGETESLKGLGIVMTEANLQQYGLEKGMLKMYTTGKKVKKQRIQRISELSQEQQIMLRYNYVMSKTTNAQGDFLRTGGGAANQTRMFQEQLKELGVTFGQYILPYFTKAIMKLNELLLKFGDLSPNVKKTILVIAGLAAVVGPLIVGIGSLISAIGSLSAALTFLMANPVVLTIVGWTAVFAGLVAGIWAVIKAVQTLVGWFDHLKRMRINDINVNFNNDELQKLSSLQASMGDKAFAAKYGKEVSKQVSSYRQSNIQNNNRNTTTNNNFYGDINSSGSPLLDNILGGGYRIPQGAY